MRTAQSLFLAFIVMSMAVAIVVIPGVMMAPATAAPMTDDANKAVEQPKLQQAEQQEITTCPQSLQYFPKEYLTDDRIADQRLIVVFKHAYMVGLYSRGKLVTLRERTIEIIEGDGERDTDLVIDELPACFPISMGPWPYEPKYQEDWMSTPEGWYRVAARNTKPVSSYEHSLLVSYPNEDDVWRAYDNDILTKLEALAILSTVKAGKLPSQHTAMGGSILLHTWTTKAKTSTAGCVGVEGENMRRLFEAVRVGDPILILPWKLVLYQDDSTGTDKDVPDEPEKFPFWELVDFDASSATRYVMKPVIVTAGE